nr:glycosyltransferase family 4 protein [Alteripontixanthobacter muriae]
MTADAVGGVWQYAADLAGALVGSGHDVLLATLGPAPSADQIECLRETDVRIIDTGLALDWLAQDSRPVRESAERIAALAADERADIVHCNSPALLGAAGFSKPTLAVAHGCLATWWQAARDEPLAPEYHWHRHLVGRGLQAADVAAAPSHSYALLLRQIYGLKNTPQVVHNGRSPAGLVARSERLAHHVLTAGRLWDDVKGAAIMDKVAGLIDVPFYAAGAARGPHGEEFTPSHLQLLGQLAGEELAAELASRPVYVSAAAFEPFGLSVLEAAQAGCPLVLSDIATFRELWEGAAIFVDPCDPGQFAEAVTLLLADEDARAKLGQLAQQRAGRFTVERMVRETEAIYVKLGGLRQAA